MYLRVTNKISQCGMKKQSYQRMTVAITRITINCLRDNWKIKQFYVCAPLIRVQIKLQRNNINRTIKITPPIEYVTESILVDLQRTTRTKEKSTDKKDGSVQRFRRTMNVRFGYKRNRREK